MEDNFASAGQYSRSDFFWWSLKKKMARVGSDDIANAVVAGLDEALKNWRPNSERGRIVVSYL
jgi:hypothetical protein